MRKILYIISSFWGTRLLIYALGGICKVRPFCARVALAISALGIIGLRRPSKKCVMKVECDLLQPHRSRSENLAMNLEAISIGTNPPEDINVIIEVPIGGADKIRNG